jgi:hypothetical protein
MKPHAETSKGWASWKREAKAKHPVRYWIAEEGLDHIQSVVLYIPEKINDVRYYINNRWVSRTHSLTAHPRDIKPGQWQDVGNRFLPCLFNELVDFVEVEQAWHHVMWDDQARKRFETPWWRSGWLRWRTWRCPDAGIEHLIWASGLKVDEHMGVDKGQKGYGEPTHQAKSAQEILELYRWWKVERPKRVDPHDASGWTEICARRREKNPDEIFPEDETKQEQAATRKSLKIAQKLEEQYEQEDEAMMIRLIKIRQALWT